MQTFTMMCRYFNCRLWNCRHQMVKYVPFTADFSLL